MKPTHQETKKSKTTEKILVRCGRTIGQADKTLYNNLYFLSESMGFYQAEGCWADNEKDEERQESIYAHLHFLIEEILRTQGCTRQEDGSQLHEESGLRIAIERLPAQGRIVKSSKI